MLKFLHGVNPRCDAATHETKVSQHFLVMPRYFFHIKHVRGEIDHQDEELPDKHAVWNEATVTARQMLQGIDGKLTPARDWQMEVTDEFQTTLYVLRIQAEVPK
ncbi:hypothetical protein ABIB94_009218 [Bradyrhizobium sp. JR7.2]|uniref:DUF6894 family protein n=1 Tax=unclassified Bradyrhizobium TaxID=2631580 RepID=UPI00339272FD